MNHPMLNRQLEILRLLRDATARGIVQWRQHEDNADLYVTTAGPISSHILFKWVAFNGDTGSDRDFVEVGQAGHHLAGTAGWWLVTEILAAGNVGYWKSHNEGIAREYDQTIAQLRSLLPHREI